MRAADAPSVPVSLYQRGNDVDANERTSLEVSWYAPAIDGGDPISAYGGMGRKPWSEYTQLRSLRRTVVARRPLGHSV